MEPRAQRTRRPGELQPRPPKTVIVPNGDDRKKQVVLQTCRHKVSGLKLLRLGVTILQGTWMWSFITAGGPVDEPRDLAVAY